MSFIENMLRKAGFLTGNEPPVAPPPVAAPTTATADAQLPTVDPAPPTAATPVAPVPPKPVTRIVGLEALVAERSARAGARDIVDQAGLRLPMAQILALAGTPAWTVDRALAVLRDPSDGGRDRLVQAMAADGVPADNVLKDALARDLILDRYERDVVARVAGLQGDLAEEARHLETERVAIEARLVKVRDEQLDLARALDAWRAEKSRTESGWAEVVETLLPGGGSAITDNAG